MVNALVCRHCGYKFKVKRVNIRHWDFDKLISTEIDEYDDSSEDNPRHFFGNEVVCDKCYGNLFNVYKKQIGEKCDDYIDNFDIEIEETRKRYAKLLEVEIDRLHKNKERIEKLKDYFDKANSLQDMPLDFMHNMPRSIGIEHDILRYYTHDYLYNLNSKLENTPKPIKYYIKNHHGFKKELLADKIEYNWRNSRYIIDGVEYAAWDIVLCDE